VSIPKNVFDDLRDVVQASASIASTVLWYGAKPDLSKVTDDELPLAIVHVVSELPVGGYSAAVGPQGLLEFKTPITVLVVDRGRDDSADPDYPLHRSIELRNAILAAVMTEPTRGGDALDSDLAAIDYFPGEYDTFDAEVALRFNVSYRHSATDGSAAT
jgi:hypothetical protein